MYCIKLSKHEFHGKYLSSHCYLMHPHIMYNSHTHTRTHTCTCTHSDMFTHSCIYTYLYRYIPPVRVAEGQDHISWELQWEQDAATNCSLHKSKFWVGFVSLCKLPLVAASCSLYTSSQDGLDFRQLELWCFLSTNAKT